jgi:hypothetical protein
LLGFIVVVIPKGQVNLSCSWAVTIAGGVVKAEKSLFEGGRGMTSRNYKTIATNYSNSQIPLLGGAGVG